MRTAPKYEGKCVSPNGGHSPRAFFYSVATGRQPLRFRRLVGLLRSRSCYRARNPVNGLCSGHAPGPAPCFGVNGSRGVEGAVLKTSPFLLPKSGKPLRSSHV
jgi:hypothetical protein